MPEINSQVQLEPVLAAYCRGIFPMADSRGGEINWYRPEMRGIIPLDGFKLPSSDLKAIRRRKFEIRADYDFVGTMRACAAPRLSSNTNEKEDESWISAEIINLYTLLHEQGFAHSVEAYLDEVLVGGLYGIAIHAAFFGESMFIRPEQGGSNSSKICLAFLVAHLRAQGYQLLDTQFTTPHLERFGCIEITRRAYERKLAAALGQAQTCWGNFSAERLVNAI